MAKTHERNQAKNIDTENTLQNKELLDPLNAKHIMISHEQKITKKEDNIVKMIKSRLEQERRYIIRTSQKKYSKVNDRSIIIKDSFVVLIILTPEYCNSDECKLEFMDAYTQNKPIIVIKVNADYGPENAQRLLRKRLKEFVDFSNSETFNESFNYLSVQIRKYASQVPRPTKSKKYCDMCKISRILIVFIIVCVISAFIIYVIVSRQKSTNERKPESVKSPVDVFEFRRDFRFSFKLSNNEYIYYSGEKTWIYENYTTRQEFSELKRNNQNVTVSALNQTIVLPSLCKANTKLNSTWKNGCWENVWASNDNKTYFYPKTDEIWLELKDDIVDSTHKLLSRNGETFTFEKQRDGYIFKLNSSGIFGDYSENNLKLINYGNWIYFTN